MDFRLIRPSQREITYKLLKSLALPGGLEPLFSP
jgi:hypothetical protein